MCGIIRSPDRGQSINNNLGHGGILMGNSIPVNIETYNALAVRVAALAPVTRVLAAQANYERAMQVIGIIEDAIDLGVWPQVKDLLLQHGHGVWMSQHTALKSDVD